MLNLIAFSVLLISLVSAQSFAYQNQTASDKQAYLWKYIISDRNSAQFSKLAVAEIMSESMHPSFQAHQDTFDGLSGPLDIFPRKKSIHTVGAVAKMMFVSSRKHAYSGIFKGCDFGIVRLSTPTAYDGSSTKSFVPAVAFKFLRNRMYSGNVLGINSLEGNPDTFNFFKHDLYSSPIALSLDASEADHLLGAKFLTATSWAMVGVSDLASFDQNGTRENNPSFPLTLVMQGTKQVKSMFTDKFVTPHLPELVSVIPPGTPLFNFWGEEPNKAPIFIGQVVLQTALTSSDFGDQRLFFQHFRKEDDFKLKPEWIEAANEMIKEQSSKHFFNGPPDLPDL